MRLSGRTTRFHAGETPFPLRLGAILSASFLWLLPSLLLAQVPRPGDDRPELPEFLPEEQAKIDVINEQADAGDAPSEAFVQYVVQLGAFSDPENAARLERRLQEQGFAAVTRTATDEEGVELTRVLAGPYATRRQALAVQGALEVGGWTGHVREETLSAARDGGTGTIESRSDAASGSGALSGRDVSPDAGRYSTWELPEISVGTDVEASSIASTPRVRVSGFRFRGNKEIPDEALLALAEPYTNRELSFEDLLRLRDELTLHYVTNGYVTSGVVLPEQVSTDGTIEFEVVEGTLGEINISHAQRLRPSWFESRLKPEQHEIVNMQRLEERLQLLQQDPLIDHVAAQLVPGPRREEAQLDLRVYEQKPFGASVDVNNHHSPAVGAERLTARFWNRNLRGGGESFRSYVAASEGLEELEAIYEFPLNSRGTRLGVRATATWSEAVEEPFDDLDIESETATYAIDFAHPLRRTLNNELSLFGSLEYRRSKSYLFGEGFQFSPGLEDDGVAKVTVLRLGAEFTHRDQKQVLAARSTISTGLKVFDATITDTEPDAEFVAFLGQFQWARRFEWLATRMIVRIDVQQTFHPLLPLEQFAVGGHATVRGYRENRFVRDNGYVGSFELRIPVWRRASGETILEIAPFFDYGKSWNEDRPTPPREYLSSAGIGLIAPINELTYGELYWGDALRDVPDISDDDNLQDDGIHFRFRRVFE